MLGVFTEIRGIVTATTTFANNLTVEGRTCLKGVSGSSCLCNCWRAADHLRRVLHHVCSYA